MICLLNSTVNPAHFGWKLDFFSLIFKFLTPIILAIGTMYSKIRVVDIVESQWQPGLIATNQNRQSRSHLFFK